ncbi:MAG: carbohydrate ABC transporter permease [Bacilli bacterium]|jgi:multiple sugar transport system permease protein
MVEKIKKKPEMVAMTEVTSPEIEAVVIEDPTKVRLSEQQTLKTKQNRHFPIWAKAWIALIPALIFLVFFTFYPIINTFMYSFIGANIHQADGTTQFGTIFIANNAGSFALSQFFASLAKWNQYIRDPANYPGLTDPVQPVFTLRNYQIVLTDKLFLNSLLNTMLLVIVSVPLTIMISLLLAVFLNSIKTLRGFYQTIFFLPYVTNSIALGMVFNVMFSYHDNGLMNMFLSWFGVAPQNWLHLRIDAGSVVIPAATRGAMFTAITIYTVWNGLAFKILVFMSGLASIDKQYYDAARIDGSSRFTIFRRITVPLLSPQIFYITITSFIGAFKSYTSVIALFADNTKNNGAGSFGGSQGTEWITVVGYIYREMGRGAELPSIASAGSVILLIVILLITLVQLQVSKRRVHY